MRRGPSTLTVLAILLLSAAGPAAAELVLPPGFTVQVYVSGTGFGTSGGQAAAGIPSTSTLAFDRDGLLYLARSGRRYFSGEAEDIWPIYRIPLGGIRMTPQTEARFLYGPPVPNPQVTAVQGGREIMLTTFDRERKVGVLYRLRDGLAEFVTGGTPPAGATPLLRQPEGVAADAAGNFYVADRENGAVLKLDAAGRVVDPRWATTSRPRWLAVDQANHVWIGADGTAEAPWQRGTGEIWRVSPDGRPTLLQRGPMPTGFSLGPGGHLFVADRHASRIFVVTASGRTIPFASFTDGDAPRALGFAPVTPQTQQAGIAGDLFLITISRGVWATNDVVRVSGPFEQLLSDAQ